MARKTSTRGGKVGPRTKTERDSQDIRRLLRAAGSCEKLFQWTKEEALLEDFDNSILPGLALLEEQLWKHQRSSEARRVFRQRTLELRQQEKDPAKRIKGHINYPLTREQIIRQYVDTAWPDLGLGKSKEAVVRRLIRKLRTYKPPN
jgi:hypothetical protein